MSSSIPEGLINSLAIQFFIDRNKNLDIQILPDDTKKMLDFKWRDEVVLWNSLSEEERNKYRENAKQYIMDWVNRYPKRANNLLEEWVFTDYTNI